MIYYIEPKLKKKDKIIKQFIKEQKKIQKKYWNDKYEHWIVFNILWKIYFFLFIWITLFLKILRRIIQNLFFLIIVGNNKEICYPKRQNILQLVLKTSVELREK